MAYVHLRSLVSEVWHWENLHGIQLPPLKVSSYLILAEPHQSSGLAEIRSSSPRFHKDEAFIFLLAVTASLVTHLFIKRNMSLTCNSLFF